MTGRLAVFSRHFPSIYDDHDMGAFVLLDLAMEQELGVFGRF